MRGTDGHAPGACSLPPAPCTRRAPNGALLTPLVVQISRSMTGPGLPCGCLFPSLLSVPDMEQLV